MHSDGRASATGRPSPTGRPALVLFVIAAILVGVGLAAVTVLDGFRAGPAPARWQPGTAGSPTPANQSASPTPRVISLSATGDIVMGNAPGRLPANGGAGFFDGVKAALAADLVMGNLEEPLTGDTGTAKCRPNSTGCHQFRAPPSYAAHLRDAGFGLLNQANNHGYDYGEAGYRNTREALERYGLAHTGAPDEITVVDVGGVTVAVAGFSSYRWSNSLVDIPAARKVIEKATTMADLVVVQVHMGAEGSDRTRVKPGTELFLGENRGDPVRFSHAVIDAGADLVVGHGPHVLRGMEFYRGRLIAYSLGNFAGGGGTLSGSGRLGYGGVLKVSLTADGDFAGGEFVSTRMGRGGLPTVDPGRRALDLLSGLCRSDFPSTGARFDGAGRIAAPIVD